MNRLSNLLTIVKLENGHTYIWRWEQLEPLLYDLFRKQAEGRLTAPDVSLIARMAAKEMDAACMGA